MVSKDDLIYTFPKKVLSSKSSLILTTPKTQQSERTIYINQYLADEIRQRLRQIGYDKRSMGEEYNDYKLLFCYENGDPIEPRRLERRFQKWQIENECDPVIDMHSLRKSSSMYKLRISGNNYQEVQGDTGHASPQVLMEHYNEVEEAERRALVEKIQEDFYEGQEIPAQEAFGEEALMDAVMMLAGDPVYREQFLRIFRNMLKNGDGCASGRTVQRIKP